MTIMEGKKRSQLKKLENKLNAEICSLSLVQWKKFAEDICSISESISIGNIYTCKYYNSNKIIIVIIIIIYIYMYNSVYIKDNIYIYIYIYQNIQIYQEMP